ncbi:MAG: glycoside hydrolase family 127 protein [Alistipes sp.]|nr:glycoside hydrolase family 127 protein [Alistipes sp.]
MKKVVIVLLCGMFCLPLKAQIAVNSSVESVKIGGYVGSRIDDCIEKRVKAQDVEHLVEPFRSRTESHRWQSEFWGKWIQGAIASYRYTRDAELYEIIKQGAEGLMATQTPDGYIGNYAPEYQLQQWDVWGRKYSTLGLLAWYDLSGDKRALKAARGVIDHLMTQVGPQATAIAMTGNYFGMASCSILEPVVYLYQRTNDKRYLEFANYIAEQLNSPEGPQLLDRADKPVARRFPHPEVWWSRENGHKAYEMMSCYEGLLEMYKLMGEKKYLDAVEKTVETIIEQEINIAGSGSAFECWYGGKERQTQPTYHTMETCVTFTWMQLCNRLLQVTHNPQLADKLEQTMYNALMASLRADGGQISKYSPLEGVRSAGEEQCEMHINCCNANGPRAFALIPQAMYHVQNQEAGDVVYVNLYAPSEATLALSGKKAPKVTLSQKTDYPVGGRIEIEVTPEKAATFMLSLRIPMWSALDRVKATVNGEPLKVDAYGWLPITREWKAGDKITLELDMRGRLVEQNNYQAIQRGPVTLARDSRFGDGFVDETSVVEHKDGYVELTPVGSDFAWMAFTAPMKLGTDLEGSSAIKQIRMCDFGSAGNTWERNIRYRVWLPKTLNVMKSPYVPYNRP